MTGLLAFPACPKIYAYTLPEYAGKNWLKIGYTTRDVRKRVNEQNGVLKPIETAAEIVFETDAVRDDGTLFLDHDFHRFIEQNLVKHLRGEWYEITLLELKAAMTAFKSRRPTVDLKLFRCVPNSAPPLKRPPLILKTSPAKKRAKRRISSGTRKCVSAKRLPPISSPKKWGGKKSLS